MKLELSKQKLKMTSLELAERIGKRHDHVIRDIRNEIEKLENVGISTYPIFELSEYKDNSGKKNIMYTFGKDGAMQIAARYSAKIRYELIQYIKKLESIIKEKNSSEWLQDRKNGKLVRRKETDAIQDKLIPLAIEQGSKNYKMLFMTYTKLIHKYAGIENGMRERCNRDTLRYIEFLESAIENCIIEQVNKGTHYKDIYQVCKYKCELLKDVLHPSTIKYIEDLELIGQD